MKTAYCFCKDLIKSVSLYGPLQDFCSYKFGKQPVFYFQADEYNPPSKDDMPFVVFYNTTANDEEPTTVERALTIGSAIQDEVIDTENDFIKLMYEGYKTIEIFDRHVLDAVKAFMETRISLGDSILGTNSLLIKGFYPQFHGVRTLQIVSQRE